MSTCKGAWKLQEVRDQVLAGKWVQYDTNLDPGTLWTWGYNSYGQLGDGTRIHRSSPVQIPGTAWNGIAAGSNFSFARKTDGTLWSWGNNGQGQIGVNSIVSQSSPIQIPGTTWNDVAGGGSHALARKQL